MYAFVYGSLKRGFGNHRLLASSEYIGAGRLTESGTMYSLGAFPAVTLDKKTSAIQGEVFAIDADTLADLDRLEGHPNFYTRTTTTAHVRLDDEEEDRLLKVSVYLMPGDASYLDEDAIVPQGMWRGNVFPESWSVV